MSPWRTLTYPEPVSHHTIPGSAAYASLITSIKLPVHREPEIINKMVIATIILGIVVIAIYYIIWMTYNIKLSQLLYYSLLIEISAMSLKLMEKYDIIFLKSLLLFNSLSIFLMSCTLIYYYLSFGLFKTLPFISFGIGLIITSIYFIYIVIKQKNT